MYTRARGPGIPGRPDLNVSGQGRGGGGYGQFTVLEAEYGVGTQVLRFAADFEQRGSRDGPALYGTVRFHSSLPPPAGPPTGLPTSLPTRTVGPDPCAGDCSGDQIVTIDEVTRTIALALGRGDVMDCPVADVNDNGFVTIDEIIDALNASLLGCSFVAE